MSTFGVQRCGLGLKHYNIEQNYEYNKYDIFADSRMENIERQQFKSQAMQRY